MPLPSSIQARLDELRKGFALKLPERLRELEGQCTTLERDGWSAPAGEAACRNAHSLAGSCGTYGFPEITEIARRIEAPLAGWVKASSTPTPAAWDALRSELRALRETVAGIAARFAS